MVDLAFTEEGILALLLALHLWLAALLLLTPIQILARLGCCS